MSTAWLRVPLAAARLTRLVTTDTGPEWLVVGRLRRWAESREQARLAELARQSRRPDRLRAAQVIDLRDDPATILDGYSPDDPITWQARLVSGADCPYCVGFWIGLGLIAAEKAIPARGAGRTVWNTLTAALGMNYVVGHAVAAFDGDDD